MKTRACWIWISLALAWLGGGCAREEPYKKPLTPVRVEEARIATGDGGVRYSADVQPYTQVNLAFKVAGYVESILQKRGADDRMRNLQEGDFVSAGTILSTVRKEDYLQKVKEAKAQLSAARALLEKARRDFDRAVHLLATRSLTRVDYDAAQAQFEEARSRVSGAGAQVDEALIHLGHCELKAPMDGVVLKREVEVGSLVNPGTVAFVLADLSSVKVVFGVPDQMLPYLKLGDSLAITTESMPDKEFRGLTTALSPLADPKSRIFNVEVTVPNPDNLLKAGMIAALQVARPDRPRQVPVVSLKAVVRSRTDPGGYAVFLVEGREGVATARLRNVVLGDVVGNKIEVLEGIQPGDLVIVTGSTLVADGESVRVIP
ncbi:MAG TPA: efflux RND transporter periplasmic adaptor subunit [Syntrophobacteraceae bacterium]|nr:efflux RND transporter periplasmic adaptor subunit [Syntrophobacteraceae bacterium]